MEATATRFNSAPLVCVKDTAASHIVSTINLNQPTFITRLQDIKFFIFRSVMEVLLAHVSVSKASSITSLASVFITRGKK